SGSATRLAPLVAGAEGPVAAIAGRVVFASRSAAEGVEPWITDGSAAGTSLLRDLDRTSTLGASPSSSPHSFIAFGRDLAFAARGTTGLELWRSDGTSVGTRRVAGGFQWIEELATLGARIVFAARTLAEGAELWTSDGSTAGTHLVADLLPGSAGGFVGPLEPFGADVLFVGRDPAGHGLFASDGAAVRRLASLPALPITR